MLKICLSRFGLLIPRPILSRSHHKGDELIDLAKKKLSTNEEQYSEKEEMSQLKIIGQELERLQESQKKIEDVLARNIELFLDLLAKKK